MLAVTSFTFYTLPCLMLILFLTVFSETFRQGFLQCHFQFVIQNSLLIVIMANSSILDSVATFEKQASNVSLEQGWLDALKAAHINTFHAVTNPGTPVTDDAVRAFTIGVCVLYMNHHSQ